MQGDLATVGRRRCPNRLQFLLGRQPSQHPIFHPDTATTPIASKSQRPIKKGRPFGRPPSPGHKLNSPGNRCQAPPSAAERAVGQSATAEISSQ